MVQTANFLFVLLFFIGSADNKRPEKTEFSSITDYTHGNTTERHRHKRGLFGFEHQFFREYYRDIGRLHDYCDARSPNGRISNWRSLDSTSYTDAILRSTSYYKTQAENGLNVDDKISMVQQIINERYRRSEPYGGPDEGHSYVIGKWQEGLVRILNGKRNSNVRSNGRKKRGAHIALLPILGISALFGGSIGLGALFDSIRRRQPSIRTSDRRTHTYRTRSYRTRTYRTRTYRTRSPIRRTRTYRTRRTRTYRTRRTHTYRTRTSVRTTRTSSHRTYRQC